MLRAPAAPPETTPIRVWLRFVRLQQRVEVEMAGRLRAVGLSIAQFDLLSTLSEREGMSQNDVASRLYVTKGNVSGLVDRLVDAGFVERRVTPGDRRANALYLTATGRRIAAEGARVQQDFVTETLGRLSPSDLAEFDRVLGAWRDIVRAGTAPVKAAE